MSNLSQMPLNICSFYFLTVSFYSLFFYYLDIATNLFSHFQIYYNEIQCSRINPFGHFGVRVFWTHTHTHTHTALRLSVRPPSRERERRLTVRLFAHHEDARSPPLFEGKPLGVDAGFTVRSAAPLTPPLHSIAPPPPPFQRAGLGGGWWVEEGRGGSQRLPT